MISIPYEVPYVLPEDYWPQPGRGVALTQGDDAVLISYGMVMLSEAHKAAAALRSEGIGLKVVTTCPGSTRSITAG